MKGAIVAAVLALMFAPLPASADDLELDSGRMTIDCSNSLVNPPAGMQVECGTYPSTSDPSGVDSGGTPTCVNPRYDIRGLAGQPSLYVFARIRGTSSIRTCGVWLPQNARNNIVTSTKTYKPFVQDEATNWSRKPIELKHGGVALLFDSPSKDRDGKCVAFTQPGPSLGFSNGRAYTRYYYIRGWVCTAPGQTLNEADAIALIKSFKVAVR